MSAELLNAYLDDELTPHERAEVDRALAASPALRRELAELDATRTLLRALPAVEPRRPIQRPATVPAPRRRPRRLATAVAAVAAIWLAVLSVGVSLGSLPVVPEVDQLALQHAAAQTGDTTMGFAEMDMKKMMDDDPAIVADLGDGMGLTEVFQAGGVVQARYSDGRHAVSIFHEPGAVDWDDMPDGGELDMMDDGPMWTSSMGDVTVVVVERGDHVVTVVADGDMEGEMATKAGAMVPEVDHDRSLWSRLRSAPGNVFDRI